MHPISEWNVKDRRVAERAACARRPAGDDNALGGLQQFASTSAGLLKQAAQQQGRPWVRLTSARSSAAGDRRTWTHADCKPARRRASSCCQRYTWVRGHQFQKRAS